MERFIRREPQSIEELETILKRCVHEEKAVFFTDKHENLVLTDIDWPKNVQAEILDLTILKEKIKPGPKADTTVTTGDIEETLEKLREILGDNPILTIESFKNWGTTQEARVIVAHPVTQTDIQSLITAAATVGIKVRCAGETHSWSPLFADPGQLLIYVDSIESDYPDKKKIRLSTKENQVHVMTGVTTEDFRNFQLENKLNLPCNVILEAVQIVSVVASGCHGVGWNVKTPGDYITQMRIFDSTGTLRTYSTDDDGADMMNAVSANFGTFGVIYDVTLQLRPELKIHTQNTYVKARSLFENAEAFKNLIESNMSVELFWFPFNGPTFEPMDDDVWIRKINSDHSSIPMKDDAWYRKQARLDYITQIFLKVTAPIYIKYPTITPLMCWVAFYTLRKVMYPEDEQIYQQLVQGIHFRRYIHMVPVRDMEFAFDLKNDYEKMNEIIKVVRDKMMAFKKDSKFPLNIAMEMRWMTYSESCLNPANIGNPANGGSGHVFYIEVLSLVGTPHWEEFCKEIAKEWVEFGGVPHLAKEWQDIPGIVDHIQKKMGKGISKFKEQLQKSNADPKSMFMNQALTELFDM